jgi:hypothetical protein
LIKIVERKKICSQEEIYSQEEICSEEIRDEEIICNQVSRIFRLQERAKNKSKTIVSSAQKNRFLFFERFLLLSSSKMNFQVLKISTSERKDNCHDLTSLHTNSTH